MTQIELDGLLKEGARVSGALGRDGRYHDAGVVAALVDVCRNQAAYAQGREGQAEAPAKNKGGRPRGSRTKRPAQTEMGANGQAPGAGAGAGAPPAPGGEGSGA